MPELFDKNETRIITIPNILSIIHLAFLPFIFHFLYKGDDQSNLIAAFLIVIGASTDIFDGYIARRFKQTSNLGRILDPLADKIYTISLMIFLVSHRGLPLWYLIIVLLRDSAIIFCALYIIIKKQYLSESNIIGKVASFSFVPVIFLFTLELKPYTAIMMWISFILILFSFISYAKMYYSMLSTQRETTYHERK